MLTKRGLRKEESQGAYGVRWWNMLIWLKFTKQN